MNTLPTFLRGSFEEFTKFKVNAYVLLSDA